MKSSQLWRSAVVGVLAWLGVSLSSPADATYYSIASVVETGSTNIVSVPFPYLQQANVYVFVNGVQTSAYSWLTSSTIQMTASAASLAGSTITVQRVTSVAATAVTFQAGGLDPNDLNTQSLQLLYAQQEIADEWAQLGVSELSGGYLSREGSTTVLATVSGTLVPGHCPQIGPLLDIIDGGACSIGGGGGSVSSGTTGQLAQYTSNGTTLGPATGSGTGSVMFNNGATSTNEALTTPTITSPIISNPTINGGTLSGTLSGGSYSGTASGTLTGTLTGTVGSSATGTTQTLGDSSNKIATDAFVAAAVAANPAVPVSSVRQTVLGGDNAAGTPSFLTTGSGLTPAFTASTPLVISFANGYGASGNADSVASLSSGGSLSALPSNNTEYLYATYASPASVTWGYNLATPQWGTRYNQLAQLSLQLNNTSLDDFGSTWTNTSVTFNNTSPHVTGAYYGVFSGTAMVQNANFLTLFPANVSGFTLRAWAKATSLAAINVIFGGATNGTYGPIIAGVNSSGKSLLYLSSAGASWDIASATTGSVTITTGTWHYYELTFDPVAGKYYYYIDGVLDQTVNSSVKAAASMASGGGLQVGLWNTIDGWVGNIAGVEYLPYCLHPAGTTYTVPTAVGSLNNGVPLDDWFDTINMVMKTPSAASASAGANPTFTTSKRVYVGEATTGASSVSSVTPYALAGYYDSGWTISLPTTSTAINKNSNLGTSDQIGEVVIECIVSDVGGYVPGDRMTNPAPGNGVNYGVGFTYTRNTITLITGSGGTWLVVPKAGGALVSLTLTNWKWKFISKRSS